MSSICLLAALLAASPLGPGQDLGHLFTFRNSAALRPVADLPTLSDLTVPTNLFGIAVHLWTGTRDVNRTLDLVQRAGAHWIRDECPWVAVEKRRGEFVFPPAVETYLRAAKDRNLEPLLVLDYGNPLYDEGRPPTTEPTQEAFARYTYEVVNRYKDYCHFWEVYNEPNLLSFWRPKPDPAAYARLLKKSYAAIKRADPEAVVIGVVCSRFDLPFIEKVLQDGAGPYMDALSVHPYCRPHPPEIVKLLETFDQIHDLMVKYGIGDKPIWCTEYGWPNQTGARTNTEQQSAAFLVRQAVMMRSRPYIGPIFWYDLQNDGTNPADIQHNYGLVRADWALKPQYYSATMMNRVLATKRFVRTLPTESPVYAFEFADEHGEHTLALWSYPNEQRVVLSLNADSVEVSKIDGQIRTVSLTNGQLPLTLSDQPAFFTGRFTSASLTW